MNNNILGALCQTWSWRAAAIQNLAGSKLGSKIEFATSKMGRRRHRPVRREMANGSNARRIDGGWLITKARAKIG